MHRGTIALALAILGTQAIWADLTIRYKFELKPGPALPAAVGEAVRSQISGLLPGEMATRVKGNKCASSFGPLSGIVDTGKGEITLFNPATKQFATVPEAEYLDRVIAQQELPAAAQQTVQGLLQNLKIDVKKSKTGTGSIIQGIQTEDNLVIVSIEVPNPTGIPITFSMELHQWWATAGEMSRVPALREMEGCSAGLGGSADRNGFDPSAIIQKILGRLPGGSEKLGDAMKEMVRAKGAPALKTQVEVYAPALMALMQLQGGQAAAGTDANAPLMDVELNLTELSTDPIPDAAFQVPEGYQQATLEELLKAMPKPGLVQAAPKTQAAVAGVTPGDDFAGPTVRAGNGVSNPVVVSQVPPQYDEDARRAKIDGSVLLSLIVDPNGAPRNIKVVRSLHPGLDQKAIEAVRQWKFRPGQKDGSPVAVQAQIEVTFRLLDKPAQQ